VKLNFNKIFSRGSWYKGSKRHIQQTKQLPKGKIIDYQSAVRSGSSQCQHAASGDTSHEIFIIYVYINL
jgi:hypothetical protein